MEEGKKANLRKAVIGGNLAFGIGWWGANQSGSSSGKSCGKLFWENLVGNSCGKFLREMGNGGGDKANLRKAVIGGNSGNWGDGEPTNQVPAWKNLVGSPCGKILWEILVGKSCGKFLWEILW